MRDDTDWHFHYPEPGDRFYEFQQTYIEVLDVSAEGVSVMQFTPTAVPRWFRSVAEFRQAYTCRDHPDEYIVRYHGNGRREH